MFSFSPMDNGGVGRSAKPREANEDPNSSLTGADLGVGLVVVFWMYGLALPISGVWQLLRHRKASHLMLYSALQLLATVPRDNPLFTPFRKAYRALFDAHFDNFEWVTPSNVMNPGPKRLATIAGPHGLFSLALNRTMHPEGCNLVMFVDNSLATFNPFITMFAKWTGMADLAGLKHSKVEKVLKKNEQDVLVVAGGFIEAAVGTPEVNRVCTHMWPYWVRQCLIHGYDLNFLWIHGGTQVFDQTESGVPRRYKLAKNNLAAITPFGKFGLPIPKSTPLRVMNVKIPLPHIPKPSREEVAHWVQILETKAEELIAEHPQPGLGVAPIQIFQPPIHHSKL